MVFLETPHAAWYSIKLITFVKNEAIYCALLQSLGFAL